MYRRIPVLLVALAMVWSFDARADVAGAKAAFKKGEGAYADGRFGEALGHYLEAFKQKPLNGFNFNLGLCYRKLGRHEEAIKRFKAYLQGSTSEANRARAVALIKLSEADAKAARAKARRARDVTPLGAKGPPKDETPPDLGNKAAAPPKKKQTAKKQEPRERRGWSPVWFWTGVGVTAALVVVGSITGGMALGKSSDYKDPATTVPQRQDLKDSGESLRTVSTAMFVSAAVVAAGTVVAYLFTDFGGGESKSAVSAVPTRGGVFFSWDARF